MTEHQKLLREEVLGIIYPRFLLSDETWPDDRYQENTYESSLGTWNLGRTQYNHLTPEKSFRRRATMFSPILDAQITIIEQDKDTEKPDSQYRFTPKIQIKTNRDDKDYVIYFSKGESFRMGYICATKSSPLTIDWIPLNKNKKGVS